MTSYSRGDVVLVTLPEADGKLARLRPAVVLHNTQGSDTAASVVPLTPLEPEETSGAVLIERGSFEAARMGLLNTLWLHVQSSFDVPLEFIEKRIGQCPYGLLDKALRRRRNTLASVERSIRTIDET